MGVTKTKETGAGPGQGVRGVVEDRALGKLGGRGQEGAGKETDWMGSGEPGAVGSRPRPNGWARQNGRNQRAGPWQERCSVGIVGSVGVAKEGGARGAGEKLTGC